MPINTWWESRPEDSYWLENTGRPTLGANLLAAQEDDAGVADASYVLVTHVGGQQVILADRLLGREGAA